jgi:hypothetical protein
LQRLIIKVFLEEDLFEERLSQSIEFFDSLSKSDNQVPQENSFNPTMLEDNSCSYSNTSGNSYMRRDSTFRRYPKSRETVIAEAPLLVQKGRVSVIPTAENMSKIVIDSVKVESENRTHIIAFLSKLPDHAKNTHMANIYQTYMDLISLSFFKSIPDNEAANASSMLMEIAKLTSKSLDFISYLIILTQAPNDLLRYYFIIFKDKKASHSNPKKVWLPFNK